MEPKRTTSHIPVSIIIGALIISLALFSKDSRPPSNTPSEHVTAAVSFVVPWDDLGGKLVSVGALDREKFLALYTGEELREAEELLQPRGDVIVTKENAHIMLNLLWGLGLAQKSAVLEKGMMMDPRFGGPDRFASTGGWTLTRSGNSPLSSGSMGSIGAMAHYSRHKFFNLSPEQEELVGRVARGIFRPCCDNATHFPDCNHGMAMLGLMELLADRGASEGDLFDAGLAMNRLWFPDQYSLIDRYAAQRRIRLTDAQTLVSASVASASGFERVVQTVNTSPAPSGSGGGCSV